MEISFVGLVISVPELKELAEYIISGKGTLGNIERKIDAMARTQAEYEAKIDLINSNTTASAATAQAIAAILTQLRADIANMGLSAAQEEAIFGRLDTAATASGALKTFLEATAANPTTEPPPVEPPPGPVVTPTEG